MSNTANNTPARGPRVAVLGAGPAGAAAALGLEAGRGRRNGLLAVAVSLAVFLLGTVLFTSGRQDLLQPFINPVYLGHQAREIFTHVLMTLPVSWGVCLLLAGRAADRPRAPRTLWPTKVAPFHIWTIGAGFVGAGIALYTVIGAMLNDAGSLGQTSDILMLIFPHFFEHSFTYLVVPAVALLTYQIAGNAAVARDGVQGLAGTEASRQQP